MKAIWAPWRMQYIEKPKNSDCIFCVLPDENEDKKNLILYRGKNVFVVMNRFPYNSGHIMVSPFSHVNTLTKLDKSTIIELTLLTQTSVGILDKVFNPEGINIGMNIGKSAGAGFDEHIHTHLVPRWNGDTNFMPAIFDTNVIPEHLDTTYNKMLPHFRKVKEYAP